MAEMLINKGRSNKKIDKYIKMSHQVDFSVWWFFILCMKKETRVKKAMELALERLDYIIDYHTAPDFVEVIGSMGGDVITYRIYDDGSIYEK